MGIDVHEGFLGTTARLDGRGINGICDDEERDYYDESIDDHENVPPMEADVCLTPLATATLYGNAVGVKVLLETTGTDFTDDLTGCERELERKFPPLHAAMVGRPFVKELDVHQPRYSRRHIHNVRVNARENAAALGETGTLDITAPQFANRDFAATVAAV